MACLWVPVTSVQDMPLNQRSRRGLLQTPITVKKHLKMTCFKGLGTLLKPYKMVVNLICTDRGGVKPLKTPENRVAMAGSYTRMCQKMTQNR